MATYGVRACGLIDVRRAGVVRGGLCFGAKKLAGTVEISYAVFKFFSATSGGGEVCGCDALQRGRGCRVVCTRRGRFGQAKCGCSCGGDGYRGELADVSRESGADGNFAGETAEHAFSVVDL